MGVMAVGAGDSLGADLFVHPPGLALFAVTGGAEVRSGHLEELRVPRVMGDMALQAGADRGRAMGIGPLDEVRVADGAESLLLRHDEAGCRALVVAVVALLFGIGGVYGAVYPGLGHRLFAGDVALLGQGFLVVLPAVLLRRGEARDPFENGGRDLVPGNGI